MKKDIKIPVVSDVFLCVVNEFNDVYKTDDWNVYIINKKDVDLEMMLIVSYGYDKDKATSKMSHKLEKLPSNSFAKVELIQEDLFALNNEFSVSFFCENQLFDKTFVIQKNTIIKENLEYIDALNKEGILIK